MEKKILIAAIYMIKQRVSKVKKKVFCALLDSRWRDATDAARPPKNQRRRRLRSTVEAVVGFACLDLIVQTAH